MIDNRRNLRDYSICLLTLVFLGVFSMVFSLIRGYFDGTFNQIFETADPTLVNITKIVLAVILVIELVIIVAQIMIAVKGIKISEKPTSAKGYITAATVFFVLNVVCFSFYVASLINADPSTIFNTSLSIVSTGCDVVCYAFFIKYAKAVRQEAV